ncbi:hypothetical protein Desdi_2775 [Desulfitobacterium dichloroeliminans LMG P-21439]|uniref:Uncharacterized protein n=1 Tax=Desulfitobacterium dichloroeliminans (strain LMG P-21439 / DCA1) TaxID=871963 RepID=L0FAE8_DESDL|nr:hypothetical protein Desdi_2775 [Desulfitobacterium dichloroeliminans LMG P-21439]
MTISGKNEKLVTSPEPEIDHDKALRRSKEGLQSEEGPELRKQVQDLSLILEKINLTEYITYLNNPRRLLLLNFGVGLVRGLGGAIGATILLGLLAMFLKNLVLLNLPVIGGVIGELVELVNAHNGY